MRLRTILLLLAFLTVFSAYAGGYLYYISLKQSAFEEGKRKTILYAERVKSRFDSYLSEYLKSVKALSGLQELVHAVSSPGANTLAEANHILDHFRDALGVNVCYLMNFEGTTIASSNRESPRSFVGKNYAFRPYFRKAIEGTPAIYMALGVTSGKRGIYYSHPVFIKDYSRPLGVVVIKASAALIEQELKDMLSDDKGITLITDTHGVVFISNQKDWLYRVVRKISVQETDDAEKSLQSGKEPWLWAGLELKGDHLAADESGDEYFIHSLAIDKCPGAIVVQLTDLMTLHKTIINPLIKRARIIILVFCALIGLSVFFLYRKAQSEINRRKNAEENLITAKEAAETANEAKSDFLANMSHELRTPLNHIIGFTEVVVDKNLGDLNAVQEEYLSDALRSGKHLLSLINEILDLSKVEAGKLELELSEVCIKKLLRDSIKMVKEKTLKHRISLSTSIDGIPDIIRLDERKMKQILYNLLSNAVKFTPDGGEVVLGAQSIAGVARPGQRREDAKGIVILDHQANRQNPREGSTVPCIEVWISDTGIGIAKEHHKRIFNAFEQVDGSMSRKYEGTGLGLSLTMRLVELHGGKIWVESEGENKGSTFRFVLPVSK